MRDCLLIGSTILVLAACSDALNGAPPSNENEAVGLAGGTSVSSTPVNAGGGMTGGGSPSSMGTTPGVASGGSSVTGGSTPSSGGMVGSVTPSGGGSLPQGMGGTTGMGGGGSVGESTCASGVQTGTACNPSADTEACVRSDRTCECGIASTWTCMPSGGMNTGGASAGAGQTAGTGGVASTGGASALGGASAAGGAGTVELDCDATMPTSGAEQHSATWAQGGAGNLAWQVWSNGGPGTLTTYDGATAFTASWNNSGDYLGRMGFEWGTAGKPYTEYGTIKADYAWNKSGTAGQYSYIGVYGWSNNPCVEWYIVEDSFHQMPFNTGDQPVGTAEVDGGTYNLVYRHTSGTGGDRCGGAGSWDQFYSIRLEGKRCGTITVSDHFAVWAERGWNLGSLLEVKLVVEAAAGQGSVEFPVANVTTSQ